MEDNTTSTTNNGPKKGRSARTVLYRRLPRNVWVVTVTSFFNDISSEMIINLIPLFLLNVLGVRTSLIGLIEGVAETVSSLVKIFSGWLSDRIGKRKRIAVLGYALSTIAKPFLYFAANWGWVMGVRFTDRVGKGLRTAPRDALVADSVDEGQRGLAFGLHRAGDTAGAVIGLVFALTVVLATQRGIAALTRETFQAVVLLSFIPGLLAVLVLARGAQDVGLTERGTVISRDRVSKSLDSVPEMLDRKGAKGGHVEGVAGKRRSTSVGFNRRFRLFLFIVVIFTLGNSSDAFLILRAQKAGLSVTGVLGMMILFNLVYTLVSTPAGALSDRFGRRTLLLGGWVLYSLVYLGFANATIGWHTWALMIVYGIYYGLTEGVAKAFVADLVHPERRGTAYGVYHAAVGLAAFPASLIAGVLWQGVGSWMGFGPGAPFIFGAALALLAVCLLLLLLPPDRIIT